MFIIWRQLQCIKTITYKFRTACVMLPFFHYPENGKGIILNSNLIIFYSAISRVSINFFKSESYMNESKWNKTFPHLVKITRKMLRKIDYVHKINNKLISLNPYYISFYTKSKTTKIIRMYCLQEPFLLKKASFNPMINDNTLIKI